MDISIIIVNYNMKRLIAQALDSVFQSRTSYLYEVIVIDNAADDGSVELIKTQFPLVHLIENKKNIGFARASNQGIKRAQGRYVLLLNPDTVVQVDTLQYMADFMETDLHIGASGCKVLLPDGSLDKACRRGLPTPMASFFYFTGLTALFPHSSVINQYHLGAGSIHQVQAVDCLVGAFLMVRKTTLDDVGLLDESFFMYGEDVDWCYRIKKQGWGIYYVPGTSIVHYKNSSNRGKHINLIHEFHRSMYIFYKKHFTSQYPLLVNMMIYLGIGFKWFFSLSFHKLLKK